MEDSAIERMVLRAQERRRLTNVALAMAREVCLTRGEYEFEKLMQALAALDAHTGESGASRAAD